VLLSSRGSASYGTEREVQETSIKSALLSLPAEPVIPPRSTSRNTGRLPAYSSRLPVDVVRVVHAHHTGCSRQHGKMRGFVLVGKDGDALGRTFAKITNVKKLGNGAAHGIRMRRNEFK
jgi:hypothetical protein